MGCYNKLLRAFNAFIQPRGLELLLGQSKTNKKIRIVVYMQQLILFAPFVRDPSDRDYGRGTLFRLFISVLL